jgi:hypothetical protein
LSQRGRRVLAALYLGWFLGGGAYLFYCAFTYRGLIRWLGDWEMRHLGGYAWRATLLGGLLVLLLPTYFLIKLLPKESAALESGVAPPSTPVDPSLAAVRVRRVLLGIGLASLAVALSSAFVGYRKSSEPVVYTPFDLSSASGPPAAHVDLVGVAQTGFIISQRERIGGHTTVRTYLPLTRADWRPLEPVAYFVEPTSPVYVDERGPLRFDPRTPPFGVRMRGVLVRDGLPGTVLAAFEKTGLKLAATTQLLDTRPAADDEVDFLVAGITGILGLLALAVLVVTGFARRRAAPGGPPRTAA